MQVDTYGWASVKVAATGLRRVTPGNPARDLNRICISVNGRIVSHTARW